MFPLNILPESGLSHSVLTTVFIGLVFMTYFTEAFGWVYTGLIVPGYLAPILIVQPWAGFLIILEAIITYLLVRLISDYASKLGIWSNFFGRDRFFAFLIISVAVRITLEWVLLPVVGSFVVQHFAIQFDYRNYLYSIGLVIVPLLANMFWKPGLRRGLLPVSSAIGVTYLVVRYVLISYTNFSVARFELLYEDIAIDFLASPKSYIVLIIGALLASRASLIYGWDYGGIIVPALFAIAWLSPVKVLLTVVEAAIIVLIGKFIVSRKFLETKTIEGPRKTLLVFTIGFILKFVIGHISSHYYPGFKATDIYGLGYLLSSLVALKIWRKNIGPAVIPALRTSIAAMLVGNVIGFFLLLSVPGVTVSGIPNLKNEELIRKKGDLHRTMLLDRVKILSEQTEGSYDIPHDDEIALFNKAIELIKNGIETSDRTNFVKADSLLKNVNYELIEYHDTDSNRDYLYLREAGYLPDELHGWGLYLFNMEPSNDLVFEVPRPLSEWKTKEIGESLFGYFDGKALLIAGAHYGANKAGSSNVLKYSRSIYNTVHRHFRADHIVQIRGIEEGGTTLWYGNDLGSLDLKNLGELIGEYEGPKNLNWWRYPHRDIQQSSITQSFISLALSLRSRRRILSRYTFVGARPVVEERKLSGYLIDQFAKEKDTIMGKDTGYYRPPTFNEMLYMDEEIIRPILQYQASFSSGKNPGGLSIIATSAALLGYELIDYTYVVTGERYLILREKAPSEDELQSRQRRKYWGIYVFKLENYKPIAIEVPHPVSETNTFEMGCQLFEYLDAQVFLLAGTHKEANPNSQADVIRLQNTSSIYHLVHQVISRESYPKSDYLIAQIRGFANYVSYLQGTSEEHWMVDSDIVFSLNKEVAYDADVPECVREFEDTLNDLGYSVGYFDGSKERLRFSGGPNLQYRFTETHDMGTFLNIWVNREIRNLYRDHSAFDRLESLSEKMGIPSLKGDLSQWITSFLKNQKPSPQAITHHRELENMVNIAQQYNRSLNIAYFLHIKKVASSIGYEISYFLDQTANQKYPKTD